MAVIFGPSRWHFLKPAPDGGYLICISGGIKWIVAPESSEVGRTWHSRNDAVTTATNCTSATGWFVPDVDQLQNPGYCCRTYWDSYSTTLYWSSSQTICDNALLVCFTTGGTFGNLKTATRCVRAFRCVTY